MRVVEGTPIPVGAQIVDGDPFRNRPPPLWSAPCLPGQVLGEDKQRTDHRHGGAIGCGRERHDRGRRVRLGWGVRGGDGGCGCIRFSEGGTLDCFGDGRVHGRWIGRCGIHRWNRWLGLGRLDCYGSLWSSLRWKWTIGHRRMSRHTPPDWPPAAMRGRPPASSATIAVPAGPASRPLSAVSSNLTPRPGRRFRAGPKTRQLLDRQWTARRPLEAVRSYLGEWSRRGDSNPRPAVYETAALPLSYTGLRARYKMPAPGPTGLCWRYREGRTGRATAAAGH